MSQPEESSVFVEAIQRDDLHLLKRLYVHNFQQVNYYIVKNSGTEDDVKDIYQEAFLAVWRNVQLARFSPVDEKEFSAYLFRVAKNKWIDELRKKKTRQVVLVNDSIDEIPFHQETDETDLYIDTVKSKYKHLGERCRELLKRFYFNKQSLKEIAAAFGWTEASAKNNKYRCLKQLRELVMNEESSI
ncbi:RNA polymerase sigma factor [Gynurincola endophyticus]|uniref:RNA polymerase sigma factor n=1 Tax=Gynurincola endophyticus TaxID=2479004 RepID=UPI000F8D6A89|nr:sigma-70 family RNA polymerase sigma factor [Gynurincola endophyticus]